MSSSPARPRATRELTAAEIASYVREGFIIVRGLYSATETDVLREAIVGDDVVASKVMAMKDGGGRATRLSLWHYVQPETVYGALAAGRRMVHAARALMSAALQAEEEPYHIHTKVILKEPRTGGAFSAHQDFGYWHACGPLDPHAMMSVVVAVDAADAANGCMLVLARSHRLGRLEHGHAGEQAGADPAMLEAARARLPTVTCELAPGDVLFTHSNLIHWSGPNNSDRWRRSIIVAFNGAGNPPTAAGAGLIPMPHPLLEVDDARLLELGPAGHTKDTADAASWLSQEKNVSTFGTRGADVSAGTEAFAARAGLGAAQASS
jgi:hypothetical protein